MSLNLEKPSWCGYTHGFIVMRTGKVWRNWKAIFSCALCGTTWEKVLILISGTGKSRHQMLTPETVLYLKF